MKTKLIAALLPLLLLGCDDLFDKGDVDDVYDRPPVLEFFPLQQEVGLCDGGATVAVQLIGEQRSSDLPANFSVMVNQRHRQGFITTLYPHPL